MSYIDRDSVCRAHFRVPEREDLFKGSTIRLTPLGETMKSFCLCNLGKDSTCGSSAVFETPEKLQEYKISIGVLSPIVGGRRRRKRQTDELLLLNDGRLYLTSYR